MLVKTKQSQPSKQEPVLARSGNKVARPVRCTSTGELMVYQTNQPGLVGDGVNRLNKDGRLILGDDGQYLRNVKVDPDGKLIVKHDQPIDVNMPIVTVQGTVSVDNKVMLEPVVVANMPDKIQIQEGLNIVQTSRETKVAPISFEGYGAVIIPHRCKVYSIHFTVYEPTFVEIVGVTGKMQAGEFRFNLFPLFVRVDELEIKTREYVHVGGYVIYENC